MGGWGGVGGATLILRLISVPNWTGTGQLELSLAKTEKYNRHRSDVLVKLVRAKLPGSWEGGGVGGKNIQNNFLHQRGPFTRHAPLGIGLNYIQIS